MRFQPVAADERGVNSEAVEESRLFKRFIVGQTNHTISYSNYGNRSAQTLSRGLKDARTFNVSGELLCGLWLVIADGLARQSTCRRSGSLMSACRTSLTSSSRTRRTRASCRRSCRSTRRSLTSWKHAK